MTEWIKNTSEECPVPKGTRIDVKYRDGETLTNIPALVSIEGRDAQAPFWCHDNFSNDIIYWRLHNFDKTLDDALGQQGAARAETTFEKMADKFWETMPKYPETTYEPLPIQPSKNALIASIFNTLYPESCALRDVHVAALKGIMKLVEERGGE